MLLIDRTVHYLDRRPLRPVVRVVLTAVLQQVLRARPGEACDGLAAYRRVIQNASSRDLSAAEKADLIAASRRISALLGCR